MFIGYSKAFVTIYYIDSKHTKTQNTHKQGLYGVNEKCNAALVRYPLPLPFFSMVKIPSHLIQTIRCFLGEWKIISNREIINPNENGWYVNDKLELDIIKIKRAN